MRKRPTVWAGALVGALLTMALSSVLYFAHQLAGLAFAPFQMFDWAARRLPGAVVTFGIDTIVATIGALRIGPTADVAKMAEQTLAVLGLILTGTLAGVVVFAVLGRLRPASAAEPAHMRPSRPGIAAGLIAGAVIGAFVVLLVATSTQQDAAGPLLSAAWTLAAFLGWGATLGWAWEQLAGVPARVPRPAVTEGPAWTAAAPERAPRPVVEPVDRRTFMIRLGGATAVITVAGAALGGLLSRAGRRAPPSAERWSGRNPLPNADATVLPARGTRPEFTPLEDHYRIDINTLAPAVSESDWRLRIGGLVERPREFTLDEIRTRFEPVHQFITLACISNPIAGDLIGTTRWTGVSVRTVLEDVGLQSAASHVHIRSVDGFDEVLDLSIAMRDPRVMLTYAWDGVPLLREHGFPLRIYIPDHYGMKQPKWIESIDATDAWEPGYWVRRGWDREARMRATSVIDTVASDMMLIEADSQTMRVPIGGIAHAGARGIGRVEVRVDDGDWEPALLRDPLSPTTWVIWRFDWLFEPGRHTFTVRCFEADGTPQIEVESPVRPSGATGLHSVSRML